MYPNIHPRPEPLIPDNFNRLCKLYNKMTRYRDMQPFCSLDALLEEHKSYQEEFDESLRAEYEAGGYEQFLVQLSWSDLPYRHATRELIENAGSFPPNPYVTAFLAQFDGLSTDRKACFIFPESYVSQFFVVSEVCKKAERFSPIKSLFPDEEAVHYLAVFDKQQMDPILLMYHLLYTGSSREVYGGYSLYEYSLPWYQTHLMQDGVVLRSPYLPDRLARFQGNLPYFHNPARTVYVRRNVAHILECGYMQSELEFFLCLTRQIMPLLQWWYQDLALYIEKDGFQINWRLERTKIRTRLTADGIIRPKWKNELSLFHAIRERYPDTLYQYRPKWLGRQSLDLYIPSLMTAIEYQGIQHYMPVAFFGGEEALAQRKELDEQKKALCRENHVRLIEWPYSMDPSDQNVKILLEGESPVSSGGAKLPFEAEKSSP